jgi:N-ethylmaleimide reductase
MKLMKPFDLGPFQLPHRVVMAPLTRMRAGGTDGVPSPLAPTYYGQRATGRGLIVAEATQISRQGQGYPQTPGIYTQAQVAGWRPVVRAVRDRGAVFFLQLWHVGRISHSSFHDGALPVAPSAVAASGNAFTSDFQRVPYETPHALELNEIGGIVADYRRAAQNAKEAGFDGVEIHAANGYLLQEFLEDKTNRRADRYGGSVENRARLLFEVFDAISEIWPAERIGVRISPYSDVNGDIADSDPASLYAHVVGGLAARGVSYLHLIEARARAGITEELNEAAPPSVAALLRPLFSGPLIVSGGFTPETAEAAIAESKADLVAFGRAFIANPDLPKRIAFGAPLNTPDPATYYGGSGRGYTDYPVLEEVAAAPTACAAA